MPAMHINEQQLHALIESEKTLLVDFWAPWCGDCRRIEKAYDEIADEYADVMTVVKLNVDNAPEIASRYSVMSIPMLLVFKNGQVTGKSVGYSGKQAITDML